MGHEDERLEEVWARESAEGGGDCAEVVAYYRGDRGVAEGGDEGDGVTDEVERAEGGGFKGPT